MISYPIFFSCTVTKNMRINCAYIFRAIGYLILDTPTRLRSQRRSSGVPRQLFFGGGRDPSADDVTSKAPLLMWVSSSQRTEQMEYAWKIDAYRKNHIRFNRRSPSTVIHVFLTTFCFWILVGPSYILCQIVSKHQDVSNGVQWLIR